MAIPFVCPICAGANAVHLISLSRAGGMDCEACGKWLRSTDVMRAMHAPRAAKPNDANEPINVPVAVELPVRKSLAARTVVARKDRIDWPPTAATRAAATPLRS